MSAGGPALALRYDRPGGRNHRRAGFPEPVLYDGHDLAWRATVIEVAAVEYLEMEVDRRQAAERVDVGGRRDQVTGTSSRDAVFAESV